MLYGEIIIPSLTVRKRKNRCIPHVYWVIAIFAVVADYSILFFPFTFFLNISHLTFGYELIICSETTDVMKIIRNSFLIPYNRQQLADYLNVDRSTMCNELSKMQKDGLIEYNKNQFLLKD